VVLWYADRKRVEALAARSAGRLRVVDEASAYFRLTPSEMAPAVLHERLTELLRS